MKKLRYIAIILFLASPSCSAISDFNGYRFATDALVDVDGSADSSMNSAGSGEPEDSGEAPNHEDSGQDAGSRESGIAGSGVETGGTGGESGSAGTSVIAGEGGTGGSGGESGISGISGTAGKSGTGGSGGTGGTGCTVTEGPNRYTESTGCQDIIVLDAQTGLIWQKEYITDRTWSQAMDYCRTLIYAGYDNWKLPTIDELQALLGGSNPVSDFPGMPNEWFWSSSPISTSAISARILSFNSGSSSGNNKDTKLYARCVQIK